MKELSPEEWRIYEDYPPGELEIRWWYEYAREAVRGLPVQFPLFPEEAPPWSDLFPEWPTKPYLLIPEPERKRRLQRLAGGTSNYLHSLNLRPPFRSHPGLKLTPTPRPVPDPKTSDKYELRYRWPISEIGPAAWLTPFRIDWGRSDREISADFNAWLKEYRPKAFPSPKGERGSGNIVRRLGAELKALGAYRLLAFYKDWRKIPSSAAIYEDPSGWMTANQKARNRLKFFQPAEPLR